MRDFFRLSLLSALLALAVSSCKTHEKVQTSRTEQTSVKMSTSSDSVFTETLQTINAHDEHSVMLNERDSVVEKWREYIVVDSTGKVLLHEMERQKEKHKAKDKVQRNSKDKHQTEVAKNSRLTYEQLCDSLYQELYNNEEKDSKPVSYRWLWFIGILSLLLLAGAIISKLGK